MGQQYDFMTDLPEPTNNDVYYKLTKFKKKYPIILRESAKQDWESM